MDKKARIAEIMFHAGRGDLQSMKARFTEFTSTDGKVLMEFVNGEEVAERDLRIFLEQWLLDNYQRALIPLAAKLHEMYCPVHTDKGECRFVQEGSWTDPSHRDWLVDARVVQDISRECMAGNGPFMVRELRRVLNDDPRVATGKDYKDMHPSEGDVKKAG